MRKRATFFVLLALLTAGAVPAEWLVFKDGSTTEIKGPLKVEGRRVLFTTKGGVLQAAALADVDLAASEELSKKATEDRGLREIKSSPQDAYGETRKTESGVVPLDDGSVFVYRASYWSWGYQGTNPGQQCVSAKVVAISTGTAWFVQVGTKVEKFRPIGLEWADADRVRALLGAGTICIANDLKVHPRDPEGRLVGYALLPDFRDLGYELLKIKAARISDERFAGRPDYLKVAGP